MVVRPQVQFPALKIQCPLVQTDQPSMDGLTVMILARENKVGLRKDRIQQRKGEFLTG